MALRFPSTLPYSVPQLLAAARQYTPHLTALGICVILGTAWGLLRINATAKLPDQADRWELPSIAPPVLTELTADQVAARFWSEQPRAPKKKEAEVKKPVDQWRFVGTVDQGTLLLAVIETEGKVRRLKAGDTLPDGGTIVDVSEGALAIDAQGTPQTLRLFVEKTSK